VKLADFTLITRRTTLAEPTDDGQTLYHAARELLARVTTSQRIRLTGVSAQELSPASDQLGLFAPPPSRAQRLNDALDRIAKRFGGNAVNTADVVEDDALERDDRPQH